MDLLEASRMVPVELERPMTTNGSGLSRKTKSLTLYCMAKTNIYNKYSVDSFASVFIRFQTFGLVPRAYDSLGTRPMTYPAGL